MICECGEQIIEAETMEGRKVKLELNTPIYLVLDEKEGSPLVKKLNTGYCQHIHKGK